MTTWTDFIPAAFALVGGVAALLLDAWERPRAAHAAALALLAVGGSWALLGPAASWDSLPGGACLVLSAVVLAGGSRVIRRNPDGGRAVALVAILAASAAVVAQTTDMIMLVVAVEIMAVSGFGLVALGGSDRAREAAMKWFVQSAVATSALVAGVGVLFWSAGGSTLLSSLAVGPGSGAGAGVAASVGAALVLSGLAFKAGAFPFHSWVPDAYETAPPVSAAALSSVGKIATLVAIARLAVAVGPAAIPAWTLAALAAASIVFGNLAALRQPGLARMLGFSAVAQVGYALVAVVSGSEGAVRAVAVFSVAYGMAIAAAFLAIEAVRESLPDWDGRLAGLAGLSSRRAGLAAALAVVMLSLTGVPLAAGFWGKLVVFGVAAGGGWAWLAVLGAVGSVVSFGYYGSVVRTAWFGDASEAHNAGPEPGGAGPATRAFGALALAVAILGVVPLVVGLPGLFQGVFGWL